MNGTAKRHLKIENTFKRLKDWRTIAMRFDRRAGIFVSARALAAIVLFWLSILSLAYPWHKFFSPAYLRKSVGLVAFV